jgi:nucleoid DNA-binding protein
MKHADTLAEIQNTLRAGADVKLSGGGSYGRSKKPNKSTSVIFIEPLEALP